MDHCRSPFSEPTHSAHPRAGARPGTYLSAGRDRRSQTNRSLALTGRLALVVMLAALLSACNYGFGVEPAAQVNGEVITRSEFQREVTSVKEFLSASQGVDWATNARAQAELPRLQADVLNNLIDIRLIRQQARQDGIVISGREIDQRVSEMVEELGGREQFLSQLQARGWTSMVFRQSVHDTLIRERLIELHLSGPLPDLEIRRVRHILVDSAEKAAAIRQRLVAGETWEKLAAEVSLDSATKERGGDLGYIERGQTFPSFEQAVFGLKVGELSQPVATPFGQHILAVLDARTQRPSGAQVEQLRQRAFDDYLRRLRENATVEPGNAPAGRQ